MLKVRHLARYATPQNDFERNLRFMVLEVHLNATPTRVKVQWLSPLTEGGVVYPVEVVAPEQMQACDDEYTMRTAAKSGKELSQVQVPATDVLEWHATNAFESNPECFSVMFHDSSYENLVYGTDRVQYERELSN
jgi:hypothetical protein